MNHFVAYFKERESLDVLETEHGFAAYCLTPEKQLFCQHFFIHPDYRNAGDGKKLLKEIEDVARKYEMKTVAVTVQSAHPLKHETLMAVLAGKFIFKGLNTYQNLLFEKEVQ